MLHDVMDGKMEPRQMNAYGALRLLAACQGHKITDHMAFETLEDMIDKVVEQRGRSSPGIGNYSRSREGNTGHYVDFDS